MDYMASLDMRRKAIAQSSESCLVRCRVFSLSMSRWLSAWSNIRGTATRSKLHRGKNMQACNAKIVRAAWSSEVGMKQPHV